MDFLCTQLNIPVPKRFAWSSRLDGDNPVGALHHNEEGTKRELEQRLRELETKHNALALALQPQSDPERPIALSSSGGPMGFGAVSPERSSLEQNPWAV